MSTDPSEGHIEFQGAINAQALAHLAGGATLRLLSISKAPSLGVTLARCLAQVPVEHLKLWCDVTGPALREVLANHHLTTLDILQIGPGRVSGFSSAERLQVFRTAICNLSQRDLIAISRCEHLREIGIQDARLTGPALGALVSLPNLRWLDLEASTLDDQLARHFVNATQLESLDVGATRITRAGVKQVCKLERLRRLDLWSTNISEDDLDLLQALPNLEYLAVGAPGCNNRFTSDKLLPKILALKSLREIWLDGVSLSAAEKEMLETRFEKVRID